MPIKTLKYGDAGSPVQLLQVALARAGHSPGTPDGIYGSATQNAVKSFQRAYDLSADGIAGEQTHRALTPFYTGYAIHTIERGDTLYRIAIKYGTSLKAVETANPLLDPLSLQAGNRVTVPLSFDIVPTNIEMCSATISFCARGLAARYPFITPGEIGQSVMGAPLYNLKIGNGPNRVIYNASHHANEWITTTLLLKFVEQLAKSYVARGQTGGISAERILSLSSISCIPALNPDGIDLVTGALTGGAYYAAAHRISRAFPGIPFPSGWKANISGVDLNLQYPAGWEMARNIKFSQGYTGPAPRDYVGPSALAAVESKSLYDYTRSFDPALTLAYHTQGKVIFWKFLSYEPAGSREIAYNFSRSSGYSAQDVPYASSFAGYKDWFIQDFGRPGYTIEAGQGENPLPISQFDRIYEDNLGILTQGAILTAQGF